MVVASTRSSIFIARITFSSQALVIYRLHVHLLIRLPLVTPAKCERRYGGKSNIGAPRRYAEKPRLAYSRSCRSMITGRRHFEFYDDN